MYIVTVFTITRTFLSLKSAHLLMSLEVRVEILRLRMKMTNREEKMIMESGIKKPSEKRNTLYGTSSCFLHEGAQLMPLLSGLKDPQPKIGGRERAKLHNQLKVMSSLLKICEVRTVYKIETNGKVKKKC